ncbi:MAG TPA: hypothetical protein VGB24_17875 [Longimicrobium sp.]|jgi:hypothetical protein|uniref:hypothetical protein n=1 Tax=Longimicrobium sp. TaxID=2029185 RepID=UPI002ED87203
MECLNFLQGPLASQHLEGTRGAVAHLGFVAQAMATQSKCPNCCVSNSGGCTAPCGE